MEQFAENMLHKRRLEREKLLGLLGLLQAQKVISRSQLLLFWVAKSKIAASEQSEPFFLFAIPEFSVSNSGTPNQADRIANIDFRSREVQSVLVPKVKN